MALSATTTKVSEGHNIFWTVLDQTSSTRVWGWVGDARTFFVLSRTGEGNVRMFVLLKGNCHLIPTPLFIGSFYRSLLQDQDGVILTFLRWGKASQKWRRRSSKMEDKSSLTSSNGCFPDVKRGSQTDVLTFICRSTVLLLCTIDEPTRCFHCFTFCHSFLN